VAQQRRARAPLLLVQDAALRDPIVARLVVLKPEVRDPVAQGQQEAVRPVVMRSE
jgi:hypothetical protein